MERSSGGTLPQATTQTAGTEGTDLSRLADKVLGRLRLPSTRRMRPVLVIMTGLPGTGKSFVATILAKGLDAAIIRTDFVRKVLFPSPKYTGGESRTVYQVAYQVTERLLSEGISVVFDGTNLREDYRRTLYGIGQRRGAKVAIVLTTAPEELVRERLTAQNQGRARRYCSDATWEVYLGFKAVQEAVQLPHWTLDTSQDISEELRAIIANLTADGSTTQS